MRQTYLMNEGWKFKQVSGNSCKVVDYFNAFLGDTKTGLSKGPNGDAFYDGNWETVDLPHDWNTYCPPNPDFVRSQGFKPQGTVWYRKSFMIPETAKERRVYLKFDAIAIHSDIYVNNVHVAHSGCGYVPINVDVTDFVKPGQRNLVAVMADNTTKEGWWYEGGGIYAPVYMIITDETHFENDGVFVSSKREEGTSWTLRIKSEIKGSVDGVTVKTTVPELGIEQIAEADCNIVEQKIAVNNPVLWDTENPKLYAVTTELFKNYEKIDEYSCNFGFREVSFDAERGCILNGKEIKLKGVANHHDHAGVGTAIPYEVHIYRMNRLRDMGCNFMRLSHSPQNEAFYKACDETGILIMNENRHFASTEKALHELRTIVRRDRNHPCVILWSLFNEEPLQGTTIGEKMARTMKKVVLEEDDTRLITGAVNGPLENRGAVNVLDVMGFNYFQYAYDFFHENVPNLPIIGSENASYMSNRGVVKTDKSKSHICMNGRVWDENLFTWSATPGDSWKEIEKRTFVSGCAFWTGFDYRGETGPFHWPSVTCSFGAMDLCGFPKDAFYWNKVLWVDEPLAFLSPHWNFKEGEEVELFCYSNCETVELFINDESKGEIVNDKYESVSWKVNFVPGTVKVIGKNNGVKVCENELKTAGKPKTIHLEPHKSNFDSGYGDACVINVSLLDENGVRLPLADNRVYFKVEGGARLIGVGNGDNTCHEIEKSDNISLYCGYCQAIIQVTDEGVPVKFIASADGLEDAVLDMENTGNYSLKRIGGLSPEMSLDSWWITDVMDHYPVKEFKYRETTAWIPATAAQGTSIQMSGKEGWAIMLSHFVYPTDFDCDAYLVCPNILGDIEIYINEDKVYESNGFKKNDVSIPIGRLPLGNTRVGISVIFKLNGEECGICENMYITVKE